MRKIVEIINNLVLFTYGGHIFYVVNNYLLTNERVAKRMAITTTIVFMVYILIKEITKSLGEMEK